MEATLDKVKQRVVSEILANTTQVLNTLTDIWTPTFENDTCVVNAEKLVKHVEMLYGEIIEETKYRQEFILSAIDQLQCEASNLKMLLTSDINLTRDIPLYSRQVHLIECVTSLKAEKEKRETKIRNLLDEQIALCTDLDESPRELKFEPVLPTPEELIEFRQYLDDLNIERQVRHNEFTKIRNNVDDLLSKLKQYYVITLGDETILNCSNPLAKKNLLALENVRQNLIARYESMRADIDQMKIKLETIWNCIGLEDEIFKKQFDVVEYDYETFHKIAQELIKPELHSKIKEKVIAARQEISFWWKKTLCSDAERAEFLYFTSDEFTDELLAVHETELKRLQDFYCANEHLFYLLECRRQYLEQLTIIEENSRDPSRFNNRGGRLLLDQKEKKSLLRSLEETADNILLLVNTYKHSTNKIFTQNGIPVIDFIMGDRNKISNNRMNLIRRIPIREGRSPGVTVATRRGVWGRRTIIPVPNNLAERSSCN